MFLFFFIDPLQLSGHNLSMSQWSWDAVSFGGNFPVQPPFSLVLIPYSSSFFRLSPRDTFSSRLSFVLTRQLVHQTIGRTIEAEVSMFLLTFLSQSFSPPLPPPNRICLFLLSLVDVLIVETANPSVMDRCSSLDLPPSLLALTLAERVFRTSGDVIVFRGAHQASGASTLLQEPVEAKRPRSLPPRRLLGVVPSTHGLVSNLLLLRHLIWEDSYKFCFDCPEWSPEEKI